MAAIGDQSHEPIDRRRLIISTISSLLILVLCLFLPAGTWAWSRGWLFLVVVVGASVVDTLYLRRVNPDVIAGRVNRHERPRRWDLLLGLIGFLPTMLAIPIVAALDDGRYHWSHVPWWGCLAGLCPDDHRVRGPDLGNVGEQVLRAERPHPDRPWSQGHRHRSLRHRPASGIRLRLPVLPRHAPGPGLPVGFDPRHALCARSWSCGRCWEDRTLREELPGYKEYAQRVRYRLVPGVW